MRTWMPSLAATTQPEWSIFDQMILGNSLRIWLVAGITLMLMWAAILAVKWFFATRMARLANRTQTRGAAILVDMVGGVRLWLVVPALVFVVVRPMNFPAAAQRTVEVLAIVGLAVQVLLSCRIVIDEALGLVARRAVTDAGDPDPTLSSSMTVLRILSLGLAGIIIALLALDNLGVQITPMLTGLGIGGIAVALAVQSILSDLFGSVTIILDKPFVVGDFIVVGDKMGTVDRIGIKTTRLRALSGEQLILANSDLLSSRIQNFKRMQERRVLFSIGVIYETSSELLHQIPGVVRAAIEKQEKTRFDRAHLKGFGAYSLDFEVVYFLQTADYNLYMDIQQAINFELVDRFAELKIEFAYPTNVQINRDCEPTPAKDTV